MAESPSTENIGLIQKREIAAAAAILYNEAGLAPGMFEIANAAGIQVSEIYGVFPNKPSIFHFWYADLIPRYTEMLQEAEGFDQLTLSEKLSNLMLTITDMLDEFPVFVKKTFDPLVFKNQSWHPFRHNSTAVIKQIVEEHQGVSRTAQILLWDDAYRFLSKEFLHVLKFSIYDSSPDKAKTMALVDHFNGFFSELVTNRIADKGTDLVRFFWDEGIIQRKIPFLGK
ncbi:MAG: TetR/AcrR family transcriptional regulator [Balneolales bacterium]|nr:TetR/AcrR family transcriptional regulator [Balneolales bacterium]